MTRDDAPRSPGPAPAAPARRLETIAIHAGQEPDPATGAVVPPLHMATTFERAPDGSSPHGWVYTRADNPTRARLEALLAALEGGAAAACFSSGSAAAASVFRALRPGERALVPRDMYHGLRRLLDGALAPAGLELERVDMTDLAAVGAALERGARLVWLETPSNPMLEITDVAAVAELARAAGATVACDVTWTPPGLHALFGLGADLLVHSSTKYLGGHSDVLGGAVVARDAAHPDFERVRFLQRNEGAVPSPFDCWLTMRGIRTLPYRMRGHVANAERVARFLDAHPKVTRVYWPGLESHPGHEVARRQMMSFGAMLSFRVAGGEAGAVAAVSNVRLISSATSLGGVESLIEHRAGTEGPDSATPRDLLRLSVGLEHPDDLLEDLDRALAAVG